MVGNTDDDRKKPKKRFWIKVEQESDSGPDGAALHQPSISSRGAKYRSSTGRGHLAWPRVQETMLVMVCRQREREGIIS